MSSSNKSKIFRIFHSMIKRRSLTGINDFMVSFDNILIDSLKWSGRLFSNLNYGFTNHNVRKSGVTSLRLPISDYTFVNSCKNLGADLIKPFDIVIALQLLSLYCTNINSTLPSISDIVSFRYRLHSLLIITWVQLDTFSFIKISLVLNSLANIVNSNIPHLINLDNKSNNAIECQIEIGENCSKLIDICKLIGDHSLEDLLTKFNDVVGFRLKQILLPFVGDNRASLNENEIDIHGVCMILKYYSVIKVIDSELLYLLYSYLIGVKEINLSDKNNILLSLSKVSLSDKEQFKIFHEGTCEGKYHDTIRRYVEFTGDTGYSLYSSLLALPINKDIAIKQLNDYFKTILNLSSKCVCNGVFISNTFDACISIANDAIDRINFKEADQFVSLLYTLYLSSIELKIVDFEIIKRFFFIKPRYELILLYILKYCDNESPSIKKISNLSSFLNGIKMNTHKLNDNELCISNSLFKAIEYVLPIVIKKSNELLTITDILSLISFCKLDATLLNRIFSIYSNAVTSNYNTIRILLKHTNELLLYSLNNHVEIPYNLHCIIGEFMYKVHLNYVKNDIKLLLKVLQTLSKICRHDKELIRTYSISTLILNITINVDLKQHVDPLINVLYNLTLNDLIQIENFISIPYLEILSLEYFSLNIMPILNNSSSVCLDISLFSKYIHLSYVSKNISPQLSQIWNECLYLLLNKIQYFTNDSNNVDFSKNRNLYWQSTNAIIVFNTLSNNDIINNYREKVINAIGVILTKVSQSLDNCDDDDKIVTKLKHIITNKFGTQSEDFIRFFVKVEEKYQLIEV